MDVVENWADVEELIRGLLPPESITELLKSNTLRYAVTAGGRDWLERVQAMRVSLEPKPFFAGLECLNLSVGNAPEAAPPHTDGHRGAKR